MSWSLFCIQTLRMICAVLAKCVNSIQKKYVEIIIMRLIYAVRINNVILAKEKENNTQFYILSHTK